MGRCAAEWRLNNHAVDPTTREQFSRPYSCSCSCSCSKSKTILPANGQHKSPRNFRIFTKNTIFQGGRVVNTERPERERQENRHSVLPPAKLVVKHTPTRRGVFTSTISWDKMDIEGGNFRPIVSVLQYRIIGRGNFTFRLVLIISNATSTETTFDDIIRVRP